MQDDHYTSEPHDERGGAHRSEPVHIPREVIEPPIDDGGHSAALYGQGERNQNDGGAGLVEVAHPHVTGARGR